MDNSYVVGKECVHRAVSVITDIVDSLGADGVSRSKQLCYTSMSDHIDTASQLLTVYMHHQHPGQLLLSLSLVILSSTLHFIIMLAISIGTRDQPHSVSLTRNAQL